MKNDALEETNATLQYIKEIFEDEKMIHCLQKFNSSNATQKLVYAGAIINYLSLHLNDTNELLNFLHSILALDVISQKPIV